MLWAAPVLALLAIPAVAALSIDPTRQPQELAFLYGMALLGTWTTLIHNKVFEARGSTRANRRLLGLGVGLLAGAVTIGMAMVLRLHGFEPQHLNVHTAALGRFDSGNAAGSLLSYFAILFGSWPARRPSRPAIARRGSASCRSCGRGPWPRP